ncbi:unnamed protein product [Plutella xylostella]|uniref:(diamondback moth) hypothetical protein n=1 Tax=Plutella xylostella TaxID=51655 RepID=A0A8S4F9D0_PLUXY|nr:unnamed protein product [Plutella xylostella]
MSIYCWTLGELALARISKKVFARVRIAKNEDGIFHDDKVLGISPTPDNVDSITVTNQLCYYVEICRSKQCLWLPYTSLQLAERSRPFYGPADKLPSPPKPLKTPATVRKRKQIEDHTLPLSAAKLAKVTTPDLNATFDFRQLPMRQSKYENAYKEFIRRGKDMIFDQFFFLLKLDYSRAEDLDYLLNVDASTEDKFETVIQNIMTEKEVKNYLQQCWRYNSLSRESDGQSQIITKTADNSDSSTSSSPVKPVITVHVTWCLVCGQPGRLLPCAQCPAACHAECRKQWRVSIMHRKLAGSSDPPQPSAVSRFSSTRQRRPRQPPTSAPTLCPSCEWGPRVGYGDIVWHKLGTFPWWPAKVLSPGDVPSCLLSRKHGVDEWPVLYYGELRYSWGAAARMCLFLPTHAPPRAPTDAVLDACDDYIAVYLT